MELNLNEKRALVTGASSGIGAGIASQLAAEGAIVAVHGRDIARTGKVVADINNSGGHAFPVIGDLATDDGADRVAEAVKQKFNGVDILVNVVGGPGEGALSWDNTTPEKWVEQLQLNLVSAVRMIQHFIEGMKERKWGRIIQIGSIAGMRPVPNQVPAYCASKAALATTSISLAMTVAGSGVTVNTISSGFIATDGLKSYVMDRPENAGKSWEELEPTVAKSFRISTGRLGTPQDIATFTAYLASPLSSWITASNFRIDGGTADWVG